MKFFLDRHWVVMQPTFRIRKEEKERELTMLNSV